MPVPVYKIVVAVKAGHQPRFLPCGCHSCPPQHAQWLGIEVSSHTKPWMNLSRKPSTSLWMKSALPLPTAVSQACFCRCFPTDAGDDSQKSWWIHPTANKSRMGLWL